MPDEHIEFLKAAFVKKKGQSFSGCQLSFLVLGIDAFLTAAQARSCPAFYQFLDFFLLNTHMLFLMTVRISSSAKIIFFSSVQIKTRHFPDYYVISRLLVVKCTAFVVNSCIDARYLQTKYPAVLTPSGI